MQTVQSPPLASDRLYPPDHLSTLTTGELQDVYRDAQTLPLSSLLNTGGVTIDYSGRRIWRDDFWKGSFARDTLLGWEERLGTPIVKSRPAYAGGRFWKRFTEIRDGQAEGLIVNYNVSFLPGRPVVRHVQYPDARRTYIRQGDSVLLLTYTNRPYRVVYDLIKVVDPDTCIGIMHLGTFPNGRTFATFVMTRNNYPFEKMAVPDHDAIFAGDRVHVPSSADVEGSWKGHVVFVRRPDLNMHNQFNPPVVHVRFGSQAVVRTLVRASAYRIQQDPDALRLTGTGSTDEIRSIDSETLIGRRIRDTRPGVPSLHYVLTRRP